MDFHSQLVAQVTGGRRRVPGPATHALDVLGFARATVSPNADFDIFGASFPTGVATCAAPRNPAKLLKGTTMSRYGITALGLALLVATASAQDAPPEKLALRTTTDQASYAIGLNIGRNIRSDGLQVNVVALLQGLKDALTNSPPLLSDEQCRAAMQQFQDIMAQQRKEAGSQNKNQGVAFLEANKKKQGVVTLPSGLQYQVIKAGTGATPKLTDTVRTHYHGTLIDGTVFDSSVQRGEPAEFPVGGVIRGWTEALQRMKVGDKWRLFIPSELAYGSRGAGGAIKPHSVLIFEIELLDIK
jgi:FKBP-type peptidyl-prolyl cis-trans isomerase FklB